MKAFPNGLITNSDGLVIGGQQGMDLRDYFAAQAMQRLIDLITHKKDVAINAYKIADAMIEARKTTMGD
jgi:hypothetical protein